MLDTLKFENKYFGEKKLESAKVIAITGAFDFEDLYDSLTQPKDQFKSLTLNIKCKIEEILKTNLGPIIIILPELYGSKDLDKFITTKMRSYKGKAAVIIAGSYYVKDNGFFRNRSTVHLKLGNKYISESQYKHLYSPAEKKTSGVEDDFEHPQVIFENTGFGDFSVIICSDLDSHHQPHFDTILDKLTNKIDIAFVVAFNKSVAPHKVACKKVINSYCYLVYVNGRKHNKTRVKNGSLSEHFYMYYPFAREQHEKKIDVQSLRNGLYSGIIEFNIIHLEFAKLGLMPLLNDMQKKGIISGIWRTPVTGINPRHYSFSASLMSQQSFKLAAGGKALAIGAHWDDILLGCLGTLLRLKLLLNYEVTLIVLCTKYGKYYGMDQKNLADTQRKIYEKFKDNPYSFEIESFNPQDPIEDLMFERQLSFLKEKMSEFSSKFENYNLIFCPPQDDSNEDHATTGKLVFSYFKRPNQTILEYQIKKYTEVSFEPNIFIGLDNPIEDNPKRSVADEQVKVISSLNIPRLVNGAERLFAKERYRARFIVNANSYSRDRTCKYGELFRGNVQP